MKFKNRNNDFYLKQKTMHFLLKPVAFYFFVISFFLAFNENISAMDSSKDEEDKLYKKGIVYRDENKWLEAVECFQPLAQKKDVKAQHNLAYCFFKYGDDVKAYQWYQAASEQGFVPSKNNLGRMNLLYLLLPNESLTHIISFFTLKDLSSFNLLSYKTHWAVRSTITRTNFLSSKSPFAIEFLLLFNNVTFEPKPKELKLSMSKKVTKGSIEVHFRDSEHLRNIIEETPLIEAEGRLYFVHDESAKDNQELIATEGDLQTVYFIRFVVEAPLKVSGKIDRSLPCGIRFPRQSDLSNLALKTTKGLAWWDLESYTKALALATVLDTFDEQLFNIRTKEAYQLLEDRQQSRFQSPNLYPSFFDLCPDARLITASNLEISQKDYISSGKSLIYISKSIEAATELQNKLPEFSLSISYINPKCSQSGVYCEDSLFLMKGFEIFSEADLTPAGKIVVPDHNLKLASNGTIWEIGVNYIVGGNITVRAGGSLYTGSCYNRREDNIKPDGMLEEDWQKLLRFWYQSGRIH